MGPSSSLPADEHGPSVCSVSRLPSALLAAILQHVPQQQRLQQCALVNSTWAAAAAAATTSINLAAKSDAQLSPLQFWIHQYGSQLTSLVIYHNRSTWNFTLPADQWFAKPRAQHLPLVLPCVELTQLSVLHLWGVQLDQLPPTAAASTANRAFDGSSSGSSSRSRSSSHSGMVDGQQHPSTAGQHLRLGQGSTTAPAAAPVPLPMLPHLQELHLTDCLISAAGSLAQFSSACCLTCLKLADPQLPHTAQQQQWEQQEDDEERQQQWQQLGQALSSLLRCFTQLKQLWVTGVPSVVTAVGLEGAAGSLTELYVSPTDADGTKSCLPARLLQLMSLQDLSVTAGDCYPSALADLRSLDRLHLEHCTTSPNLKLSAADSTASRSAGQADTLLGTLAHLTGITVLNLYDCDHGFLHQQPEHFSAITACADITRICIEQKDDPVLPAGALRHMFPPGRQLTALKAITLEASLEVTSDLARLCFMNANELGYLVSACPALTRLAICNALGDPAGVAELLRLPQSCQHLSVGGVAFTDDSASFLARLTQLTNLEWSYSPELTDHGLEQLTVLTGLMEYSGQRLPNISQEMFPRDDPDEQICVSGWTVVWGGAFETQQRPIWSRLADQCDRSPLCAPGRLAAVRREHAQLIAVHGLLGDAHTALKQRVEGLEQQLSGAREQLATQHQLLLDASEQLASQRQLLIDASERFARQQQQLCDAQEQLARQQQQLCDAQEQLARQQQQ